MDYLSKRNEFQMKVNFKWVANSLDSLRRPCDSIGYRWSQLLASATSEFASAQSQNSTRYCCFLSLHNRHTPC